MDDDSEKDGSVLDQFLSTHLRSHKSVNTYRKAKKYSRIGLYLTGGLSYIIFALYLSGDYTFSELPLSIGSLLTGTVGVVTAMLYLNRRSYDFDEMELTYHEISALIEVYKTGNEDRVEEQIERCSSIVLDDDNQVLPFVWRRELDKYFSHIKNRNPDMFFKSFGGVASRLVTDLNQYLQPI